MGSVIRYKGKRGVVLRIKYRDADGRQVMETLGAEDEGWTDKKARREIRNRETDVEREGLRKPDRTLFGAFATAFLNDHLPGRNLKPTGLRDYRVTINNHLIPFFGRYDLSELEQRPELVDRYISAKTKNGLSAKTIGNHLIYLNVMLGKAVAWRLIRTNPMVHVERPKVVEREMSVLTAVEIAELRVAYDLLATDAETDRERMMWHAAKAIVFLALATGMRRGELLGLRWRNVKLLEGLILVREQWVEGAFTTPKSRAGRRTIELGPRAQADLQEHWTNTAYRADDSLVFCHPQKGSPLDPGNLHRNYLRPALTKAGVTKPFRPFHDMRHTSLTHEAAAGNPSAYLQLKAGHSRSSITDRYIHAAQVLFPGAAALGESRLFGSIPAPVERVPDADPETTSVEER